MPRRLTRCIGIVSLLASLAVAVTAPDAAADSVQSIPGSVLGGLAVTATRVFVAAADGPSIQAYDQTGNYVGTIPDEAGTTDLVTSADGATLYAARPLLHAIDVIDTAMLRRTAQVQLPNGSCPYRLAVLAARLWVGASCPTSSGTTAVYNIDTTTDPPSVDPHLLLIGAPPLATSAALPNRLVVLDSESPAEVSVYATDGGVATLLTRRSMSGDAAIDVSVTADGADIVLAGTTTKVRSSDLADDGPVPTGETIATGADDRMATGNTARDEEVVAYHHGSPITSYFYGGGAAEVVDHGLRYSPDGSHLYALSRDPDADALQLHTYATTERSSPLATTMTLAVAYDPTPLRYDVTGTLRDANGSPVADALISVTIGGSAGQLATDANGIFATQVRSDQPSEHVTASFAGDSLHGPSDAAADADARRDPELTFLSTPVHVTIGTTVDVLVGLGATGNRRVAVYATPDGGTRRLIGGGDVPVNGVLRIPFTPTVHTVLEADYVGNAEWVPAVITNQLFAAPVVRIAVGRCSGVIGHYQVCPHTSVPVIGTTVVPAAPGACATFFGQWFVDGAWHALLHTACLPLNAKGQALYSFGSSARHAGGRYRFFVVSSATPVTEAGTSTLVNVALT